MNTANWKDIEFHARLPICQTYHGCIEHVRHMSLLQRHDLIFRGGGRRREIAAGDMGKAQRDFGGRKKSHGEKTMIKYKNITGYKYQLLEMFEINVGIEGFEYTNDFLTLCDTGTLFIKFGYAWDGPSGPTIDTKDFMRGSLVHDALYQLMRLKVLDYKIHRVIADKLLYTICRECGMPFWRAQYVYYSVRFFAEDAAKKENKKETQILEA